MFSHQFILLKSTNCTARGHKTGYNKRNNIYVRAPQHAREWCSRAVAPVCGKQPALIRTLPGSGRVDMLTSPVAAARAAIATGAWVKSKHDMHLIRGSVDKHLLLLYAICCTMVLL